MVEVLKEIGCNCGSFQKGLIPLMIEKKIL